MFDMPWVELWWPDTPIKVDATVAVLISHFGFWSLNACRIVYEIDERGACERFGFAYGTLPQHGERGEERFSVEFQPTKAFGTTFTPFPGQVPRRVWPIHTRELCKNALQQIQKRPCAGQRNAKEISTGCNLRQEEFFR